MATIFRRSAEALGRKSAEEGVSAPNGVPKKVLRVPRLFGSNVGERAPGALISAL